MNERIRELMLQASEIRVSGFGDTEILDPEKFAELIIRECAFVTFKNVGPKSALTVLEHFGLEEEE